MLFSSFIFLFIFLPVVMLLYLILPVKMRNGVLLLASLIFYGLGEPEHLVIMLGVIIINYFSGIALECFCGIKRIILTLCISSNLLILAGYKYLSFLVENVNIFLLSPIEIPEVILPIGISFYIFQAMSYTIDVYRKVSPVQKNIFKLALYISLFPQLVAGPIVRYKDFIGYTDNRQTNMDDILAGIRRFIVGLGKKVIIADSMGKIADGIFATGSGDIAIITAWIGAIAYSLQILFDFSGYSDMAIGLGRMFGFKYMENFNFPYIASSITEFWRRWHISLSSWFKDYLYIPLGGNRCSKLRNSINLFIVFFLTGLWHGASWNFIVWGLWHGVFLILEKRCVALKNMSVVGHIYTMLVVVSGWVIFRTDTLPEAMRYIGVMFGIGVSDHVSLGIQYYVHNTLILSGIIGLFLCYPWSYSIISSRENNMISTVINDFILLIILLMSIMYLAVGTYNPFIYFRF